MNRTKLFIRLAIIFALIPFVTSCAYVRGVMGRQPKPVEETQEEETYAGMSQDEYAQQLRKIVRKDIEEGQRSASAGRHKVISRKPYFYKEYREYPDGSSAFEMDLRETESRTAPYMADVTASKLRFSTRLHRQKDEARDDTSFLRDTGTETITYQLRNSKWKRVGSLYVADRTDELVNGEWRRVEEAPSRTAAAEESQDGWASRTWDRVRFWR